ncbi:MAG: hypothetical protein GX879_05905 [Bacteroidales bacterium]|nr:hypothetical protein [Bacteroidales bacterium]
MWFIGDSVELNNGFVEKWYDISGNDYHFVQTIVANQPSQTNKIYNGHSAIKFDGTNDYLKYDFGIVLNQPLSFFVVWKRFIRKNNAIFDGVNNDNRVTLFFPYAVTDALNLFAKGVGVGGGYNKPELDKICVNSILFSSPSKIYENGVLKSSPVAGSSGTSGITLGASYSISNFLNGEIAEFIFYDNVLSDEERIIVENYLMNKYAPNFNLGEDIISEYSFCPIDIGIPPGFSDVLWSTGSIEDSITITNSGQYWVSAKDFFGRTISDTINVSFPSYLFQDSTICLGDTLAYNFTNPQDYDINWSNGQTGAEFFASQAGHYTLNITDSHGCSYTSNFEISIDSFPAQKFIPSDTAFCSGNTITASQNDDVETWHWYPGNETTNYKIIYEAGEYVLSTQNHRGCQNKDTINISIQGVAPHPLFNYSHACSRDEVLFSNSSYPADSIASFFWTFSNGETSEQENPQIIFDTAGNYNVNLKISSHSGCENDTSLNIEVYKKPEADFSHLLLPCANIGLEFQNNSDLNQGYQTQNIAWYINQEFQSDEESPFLIFPSPDTYTVSLVINTDEQCSDSVAKSIIIPDFYEQALDYSLINPKNNSQISSEYVNFEWNISDNAQYYKFELSNTSDFSNIIEEKLLVSNEYPSYENTVPMIDTAYYWRITAYNPCMDSIISDTFKIKKYVMNFQNLKLWLAADKGIIEENGFVSQWTDLSGNENHAVQENEANQPKITSDSNLGFPSIKFDGVNDYLITDFDTVFEQAFSIFVVWKINQQKAQCIFDGIDYDNSVIFNYPYENLTTLRIYAGRSGGYSITYDKPLTQYFNFHSLEFSNPSKMYDAGVLKGSMDIGSNSLAGLTLGAIYSQNTRFLNGHIAEIILYDTLLPDISRIEIENYLVQKYAPPVNLGYDIRVPYGFCDTVLHGANKPWFTEWEWSTGETDSVISVNKPGTYSVTATDIFGNQSNDQILVFYPKAEQINDTTLCMGDVLVWNTGLGSNYEYSWLGSSSQNAETNIDIEGEYAFVATDSLGCKYYSDTVNIYFSYYELYASLGNQDTLLCSGSKLHLIVGADETSSYQWNDNSNLPYLSVSNEGIYSLNSTNIHGCNASNSINVSIQGLAPEPMFSSSGICATNLTSFVDLSHPQEGNLETWQWYVNSQPASQLPNFDTVFSQAGVYNIRLEVSNSVDCYNFIDSSIIIRQIPIPDFSPKVLCSKKPYLFSDLSSAGEGEIVSTIWSFNNEPGINASYLYYEFQEGGEHNLLLQSENSYGCKDSIDFILEVKASPKAEFTSSNICVGEEMYFVNMSEQAGVWEILEYNWNFGDGNFSNSSNPVHTYQDIGEFEASLIVKSLNGCADTIIKTMQVNAIPVADFIDTVACVGSPHQINSISEVENGNIVSWTYVLNDSEQFYDENPMILFEEIGNNSLFLEIVSDAGCKNSVSHEIIVKPLPTADFSVEKSWGAVPFNLETENLSSEALYYFWDFGDGNTSNIENATNIYYEAGDYDIVLTAFSEFNCKDSAKIQVQALEPILDIALLNMTAKIENSYLLLSCDIINAGALPVSDLDIIVRISPNTIIREKLEGVLMQGELRHHEIKTQMYLYSEKMPASVCIEAYANDYPYLEDINLENQKLCKYFTDDFIVFQPYPNPSDNMLNLDFVNPHNSDFTLSIFNSMGDKLYSKEYTGNSAQTGSISISISNFSSGLHAIILSGSNFSENRWFVKE